LISSEAVLGLPGYQITGIEEVAGKVRISARHGGPRCCPHCNSERLRLKDKRMRRPRHESWGLRHCILEVESCKFRCKECRRSFWQRFPGILPHKRATEPFRRSIFVGHYDGVNRSRLGRREGIGGATVERWFQHFLQRELAERRGAPCPRVLGIDEHFFSRKDGYATTFCDLRGHKIFDVVLGRSEAALESYLAKLPGKDRVRIVCMDLASVYRALVRKHFPKAKIVADRFHVIRLINHHFLACWREIDPAGAKHRGLLSLMRRHRHNLKPEQKTKLEAYFDQFPVLREIYRFKQRLCYLLLKKHRTRKNCTHLAHRFIKALHELSQAGLTQLVKLGQTLTSWASEIAMMWRFTRNNGITEGFHTKMEVLQRQAYGFRNFANYRLRVKIMCS
jgi:transposase